ncbi:MAG TPA: helix-turn-helix domain-containing protein [Flavobacteriaceae bacterium]|nr:helix-turn-helix domain-containing protein [Flavobacteriaceae bacterium]
MGKKKNKSPKGGEDQKKGQDENKKILFASLIAKESKLLTTGEVMQLMGLSQSTMYRLRKSNSLPCVKLGGTYLYSLNVLYSFFGTMMTKSQQPKAISH